VRDDEQPTVFEQVGGMAFFVDLVDRFYAGVAEDEVLRPMYPQDLGEAPQWLALFLAQYWGGPTSYNEARGHPRLRMRHMPFRVDVAARDAWLTHMIAALREAEPRGAAADDADLGDAIRGAMTDYFVRSADFLRNVDE